MAREARRAEQALAEARAAEAGAARPDGEESDRTQGLESAAAEETQVIPVQVPRQRGGQVDDRPHLIPGFDRDEDDTAEVNDPDATTALPDYAEAERTQALPRLDDTVADTTQIIPGEVPDDPKPPTRPRLRRRR